MNATIFALAPRPTVPLLAALCLAGGTARAADPPCEAVALEVAPELGDDDDDAAMRTYLSERLPARMQADGLCVDPEASRSVVITVAWSNAARGDYAIALRALAPEGEPFEPSAVDCPGCATVEVLDTIAAQIPVALAGLHEPALATDEEPAPPSVVVAPTSPREHDRPRVGRLGRAGIGLGATGVAGIVAGAVLWAQHSVPHPADSSYRLVLAPAGITLVVTGAVATAAGATMFGVDRRRARTRHTAVRPTFDHAHVGVVISGAF
jgi:hypothetical protein